MDYKQVNDYEVLYLVNDNNEDAYSLLFYKYKPIIISYAKTLQKKYYNSGLDFEDLYQEGMLGLSLAIKSFDSSSDNTFYTFAVLCIKRTMEKILLKSLRAKNLLNNKSCSLDDYINDEKYCLNDIVYSDKDVIELILDKLTDFKELINFKYNLNSRQMPVFELKVNGFSNGEIATLLDMSYKEVDNCLYYIKKTIKKLNMSFKY